MAYNFAAFDTEMKGAVEWLKKEYTAVRTGRATPALLDGVQVESYGARMPLSNVGSVSVEDARTLRVSPWDASQVKAIEKAITEANLGLSVVSDDRGLRVVFPELTSERREQLLKLAKSKLEDSRVSVRKAREEEIKKMDTAEKGGTMSKDDVFRAKAEVQKRVDATNTSLEDLYKKKEQEISQ